MRFPTVVGYKGKASGFRGATKGALRALAFVVVAVLGSAIAVSALFLMYLLARRWM